MDSEELLSELAMYEQLLNTHSGKRYHIRSGDDWKFSLIQVVKMGTEKEIVSDLNAEQMYAWVKRHLIVDVVRD